MACSAAPWLFGFFALPTMDAPSRMAWHDPLHHPMALWVFGAADDGCAVAHGLLRAAFGLFGFSALPAAPAILVGAMNDPALRPLTALPADLHVLVEHQVWARVHDDGTATVGITPLGIALSGEIYMCRPKRVGSVVAQGGTVAVVELSKSIVAVKSPVSGTVVEVNPALEERPDWVHREPCGAGWIARVRLADFAADQALLLQGAAAHEAMAEHERAHAAVLSPSATGRPEGSP